MTEQGLGAREQATLELQSALGATLHFEASVRFPTLVRVCHIGSLQMRWFPRASLRQRRESDSASAGVECPGPRPLLRTTGKEKTLLAKGQSAARQNDAAASSCRCGSRMTGSNPTCFPSHGRNPTEEEGFPGGCINLAIDCRLEDGCRSLLT